ALGDLLKHSMIQFDGDAKRYQLHDLSRLYAVSQLGEAERYGAERRHAEHFKSVADSADELYKQGGGSVMAGLALFDRDWVNIQTAQAWASAHAAVDDTAAVLCSQYPKAALYCLALRLHPQEQVCWAEIALAAARRLGLHADEGYHLGNLGIGY